LAAALCGCDATADVHYLPGGLSDVLSSTTDEPSPPSLVGEAGHIYDDSASDSVANEPDESDDSGGLRYRDFTVYRQSGEAVTLSDYIGTPIVINFWATWCPPCVVEMPHFSKLDGETDDVLFFMVSLTDGVAETPEKVEKYLNDSGLTFKNVLLDLDGQAKREYEITAIPTTVFINDKGSIIGSHLGTLTEDQLRQGVAKLFE